VESLDFLLGMSDQIDRLPEVEVTAPTDDPIANFDVFWTTFDEYYALFDLAEDVDWKETYETYRARVTPDTTKDELWEIFSEMIAPLNDGHTMLLDFENQRQMFSRPVESSPSFWMMESLDAYSATIAEYLDTFSPDNNVAGNGNILYGTIGNRIGYVNILSFEGYAEPSLAIDEFSILAMLCVYGNDIEAFSTEIDRIFAEFSDMDGLIIDLRFNMGGSGDLAVELTNRLVSEKQIAYSHQVRFGEQYDDLDDPVYEYAEPKGVAFLDKPIIVLTSRNTVSAGDLQAMLLKQLPNVTVIGETTFGIFSEGIPRHLPNGWMFTLSTQRLYSETGEFYEQKGISPHIGVHPDADRLHEGNDNMLDAALVRFESGL